MNLQLLVIQNPTTTSLLSIEKKSLLSDCSSLFPFGFHLGICREIFSSTFTLFLLITLLIVLQVQIIRKVQRFNFRLLFLLAMIRIYFVVIILTLSAKEWGEKKITGT